MRIAMAVQGVTDSAGRTLRWSPITPEDEIGFADHLERAFGVPVILQNDCNMIAVAVGWRNPARFHDNFLALLLSNGIGMGLILRGAPFAGSHSSGGEFGHMIHVPNGARCRCGRHGCVEAYAGSYAILRNARGEDENAEPMADIDQQTMQALAAAARQRPGPERRAFETAGNALGFALGSLFALIDPAPVAMVGPGVAAFDIIEPTIRDAISRTAGGQHGPPVEFDIYPDERPLIREGTAMTALTYLDNEVFAPGMASRESA
jgi:predicted NBD/HSP70 family sugar kinase